MIDTLLLDLDDTILDFKRAERIALEKTLLAVGIQPTEAVCTLYSRINQEHWEMLERGELTRQQVLVGRYRVLLERLDIPGDVQNCARIYERNLGQGHYFLPGAYEAVESLSKHYRLYLVSNGTATVQHSRLESAGIGGFFRNIFISQDIGINKPDKGFFDACFAEIENFDPKRTMIVGDSLTSDILGGKNAGICTCWVNPEHKECKPQLQPDYQIESITQLKALLETLK